MWLTASQTLLTLSAILGFGGLFGALPPAGIVGVPLDGAGQSFVEVCVLGRPSQFAAQFRRIDGVAAVVTRSVLHPIEIVGVLAHGGEDSAQDIYVAPLPIGSDEISFSDASLGEDGPNGRGVVLGVNPVAYVPAVSVELRADAAQNVGDLPRDELLDMLVGSVVVRAVGYGGFHAIGAMPGADEHVGRTPLWNCRGSMGNRAFLP